MSILDKIEKVPVFFGMPSMVMDNPEQVLALSDAEFAQYYFEKMNQYKNIDGWWKEGKVIRCSCCREEISGPRELRRYSGASLHPSCFKKEFEKDQKNQVLGYAADIKYWQRVANVDLSNVFEQLEFDFKFPK